MKRSRRFLILALAWPLSILMLIRKFVGLGRTRKNRVAQIGFLGAAAFIAVLATIAAPIVQPASAVTIRSSNSSDSCTVDVGNASNATIQKVGNYCNVWVTASTTVSIPAYTSSIGILVVGGGAGGFGDGGSGGSGGEARVNSSQSVTAGAVVSVNIGGGGGAGVWGGAAPTAGGTTTVSGAGLNYSAVGGNTGSGWGNSVGPAGGSGGVGGTGYQGGAAGGGPGGTCNPLNWGGPGGSIPSFTFGGISNLQVSGGGGGGIGANTYNNNAYYGLGPAGGAGGGGRGANLRYAVDDTTWRDGASAGHNATYYGGGGGGGAACDAYASGQNGTYQRTNGGAGYQGVVIMSFLENKLSISQQPDGCISNATEACLQSTKIQLQDYSGTNLSTAGVTVTLVSTSIGTLGGTLSATTDASGLATLDGWWITGASVGNSPALTFEAVGYRNIVTTVTMKAYAETLNVVSGSTDSGGSFFGTTGKWLATATTSNISVSTLAAELGNRDVTLRAASASTGSGNITWAANAVMVESASTSRSLSIQASNSFSLLSGGRISSTGQPLNVVVNTNMDATMGGMIHIDGTASAYAIETNGGHVALGGGGTASTFTWSGLTVPTGSAAGYATTNGTGSWWGVELGVNTNIAGQKLIKTNGGNFRAYGWGYGFGTSGSISSLYGIAWESGIIDTGAGSVAMYGGTTNSPNPATGDNVGVGLGVNHSTSNDAVQVISSGAILLNGAFGTAGTSNAWGVSVSYADLDSGSIATTINGSGASYLGADNTFRGPVAVTPTSNIKIGGVNTFNKTATITGNSVTTTAAINALDTVSITASSGNVTIGGSITGSTASKAITIKATADILHNSGTVSTQGGAITYASDSDAVSDGGILVAGSINSNGGAILLGGNDASATGYAKGTANITTAQQAGLSGIRVGSAGSIASAAGAITMRGQATATGSSGYNVGVEAEKGSSITSTTGAISITGIVGASNTASAVWQDGVILGNIGSGSTTTISSTSGAITITGNTNLNTTTNRIANGFYTTAISSTSGNIQINCAAGVVDASSTECYFNGTATINSGSGTLTATGTTLGAKSTVNNTTFTSSTAVTLQLPTATFSGATLAGASPKVVESPGGSFTAALTTTGLSVSSDSTSLRIGKATNTANVTNGTAWTLAGPVSIYGGNASQNANVTITAAASDFLIKTTIGSYVGNSVTIQTSGGNIVLWANYDKVAGALTNSGRLSVGTNSTLRSQGGKIWLGGGLDDGGTDSGMTGGANSTWALTAGDGLPDGYAQGNVASGEAIGAYLNIGGTLSSAGGDIFIAGMEATSSSDSAISMITMSGVLVDSGAGRIGIWGKSSGSALSSSGVILHRDDNTADTTIYSASRRADAITVVGDNSTNTNNISDGISAWGHGVLDYTWYYTGVHIIAAGLKDSADLANYPGGGITMIGRGYGGAGASGAHGIIWQWGDVIAKDGPITMSGYESDAAGAYNSAGIYVGSENGSMYQRFGAYTAHDTTYNTSTYTDLAGNVLDMTTSNSNITLNATKFVFFEYSNYSVANGYHFKTSGDITLQSTGSTFTSSQTPTHWQFGRITISGTPRNFTVGKPTDTSYYNWFYPVAVTGSIKFYAGKINLYNSNTFSTSLGSSGTATRNIGILVKTSDRAYVGSGSETFTTGGSDIVFWTDSDNDGYGAFYSESGMVVNSGGGDITFGGGLDDGGASFPELINRTAGDGLPDGYANGVNAFGNNYGIQFVSNVQLLSGGGNIWISGRGSATTGDDDAGVAFGGALVYSGAGKINISGRSPASCANNWHRAVMTGFGGRTHIISNNSEIDAIRIYGNTASCDNTTSVYANAVQGQTSYTDVAAPNGGGIQIYGTQGSASYTSGTWGNNQQESDILELNYWNIVANSGRIKIDAVKATTSTRYSVRFDTRAAVRSYVGSLSADVATGYSAYPTLAATASTSDVLINADSICPYNTTFNSTGNLKFQPNANTFDYDSYFDNANWGGSVPFALCQLYLGQARS